MPIAHLINVCDDLSETLFQEIVHCFSYHILYVVLLLQLELELLLYSFIPAPLVPLHLYEQQMRQALIGWVVVLRPRKLVHVHPTHH
jgi:hypothetical protein